MGTTTTERSLSPALLRVLRACDAGAVQRVGDWLTGAWRDASGRDVGRQLYALRKRGLVDYATGVTGVGREALAAAAKGGNDA